MRILQRIADRIPGNAPTQYDLFRIAHAEDLLEGYIKTVNEEWPTSLAASYHAERLRFENTMRQFPRWRQFKHNAARNRLDAEQIEAARTFTLEVSMRLEGEEARRIVEPLLPQALKRLANEPSAVEEITSEMPPEAVAPEREHGALDKLQSLSNTLKSIAGLAFSKLKAVGPYAAPFGRGVDKWAKGAGKGFEKAAEKQGPKDGEKLFKWLRRFVIGEAALIAGVPWAGTLATKFPKIFGWLEPVVEFLKHFTLF